MEKTQYVENVNWSPVASSLYTPIQQGIVLLRYSKNDKTYRAFYDFILSDKAKAIFKKYGYSVE